MTRFVIDARLPPALARWLVDRGYEAEHVADRDMQAAPDSAIWTFAHQVHAAILKKDEDFAQRRTLCAEGPAIVWLRLPNTRRRDLLVWFEHVLPQIEAALARGETLIEIV